MQIAKYTPGPWIVDDRHVHPVTGLTYPNGQEPETDLIVLVDTDHHDNGLLNETDKANLRLIAAAPDLLEALDAINEVFEATNRAHAGLRDFAVCDLRDAIKQARAALSKARGE